MGPAALSTYVRYGVGQIKYTRDFNNEENKMQTVFLILAITVSAGIISFSQTGPSSAGVLPRPRVTSEANILALVQQKPAIATASQVNGTWRNKNDEFKVWALGNRKLRVEFSGTYEYKSPAGPMANTGECSGIAIIEGDTAVFKPEGAEQECRITMKFAGGKMIVDQQGICGFGNHVIANGTYHKISSRKPKFGEE
jgi:hypothetical protein